MHAAPRLRADQTPRLPIAPAPRRGLRPAPWPESEREQPARPAPHSPDACLPLRPAGTALRPVRALPGTVPFDDAAQAWFWTVAALAARHGATIGQRAGGDHRRPRVQRPCDPDDVIRALDLLYRRGGIGPLHARVLRRWGERFTVPPAGGTAAADAELWAEAMAQLDGVLRPKGILA